MKKNFTLFILFYSIVFTGFSQGTETFSNLPALNPTSSYGSFSWTGDNGLTWSATDSRTDQSMNGKAIVIRNGSMSCAGIPNGIGSLTFSHQQFFGGSGGKLDVYINGNLIGSASPTTILAPSTFQDINVSGNFTIEIKQSTSGLRIGVDDLSWTAYNALPCEEPSASPSGLNFTSTVTSVNGTFALASPVADNYLIVRSTSSSLAQLPEDGVNYPDGATLGNGNVVTTVSSGSFQDNNLSANTGYYYFIFSFNNEDCGNGPDYLTSSFLSGNISTQPMPLCAVPAASPTGLTLTPSATSVSGNFDPAGGADYYLVVMSSSSSLSASPVNGTTYSAGQSFGGGTVINFSNTNYFTATPLSSNSTYYFFVFAANNDCTGTPPVYNSSATSGFVQTTNNAGIPAGYYSDADGLTCAPLKDKLTDIISFGTTVLTYTPGVWQAYQFTDIRRNDENTADIIWDMYSDNPTGPEPYTYTYQVDQCGSSGYSKEGDCYNREHSTPKSWFNSAEPMYTDVHHLFPTDGEVNNYRSNYPYGEVTNISIESENHSKLGTGNNFGYTGTVFEPIDEYKGDFARASLYMATRYQNEIISQNWAANGNANELFLTTTEQPDAAKRKLQIYDDWYIKLLFKWIKLDPVSQKEIDRNDAIYYLSGQHNRNPFVDHPEYAALIWQCTGLLPVTVYDFKAVLQGEKVVLQWDATRETNFSRYDILRSEDGINFYKIGSVNGANISHYFFTDNQLPEGNVAYYRLKMVDIDGASQLGKVVTLRLNNIFSNAVVYPNPVSGILKIKLDRPVVSGSKIQITDVAGRVMRIKILKDSGLNIQENVSDLPQGRYFVRIMTGREMINSSFVILR